MSKHQLALPGLGGLLPPLVAVLCFVGTASFAVVERSSAQQGPGRALEAAERREVVEALIALLEERYVFPGAVGRIADSLRSDLATGRYEGVADPETFADRLSGRLREISGDGHLWVAHQPVAAAEGASGDRESPAARRSDRFVMFVAEGRVTSPVTGDNWQGTGVEPDVEVAAADAPDTAHRLALEHLRDRESDDARVRELDRLIAELTSREGSR